MLSKYRGQPDERANFHEALVAMQMLVFQAASAVALWKCLHCRAQLAKRLNRETSFLDAAMSAAWTAAIMRCYALQDSKKSALSLDKILTLSAERDEQTSKPFISESDRNSLKVKLEDARKKAQALAALRHNQQAHISSILTQPDLWDVEPAARQELQEYVAACLHVLVFIEERGGYQTTSLPNFYKVIDGDLDVLFAEYPHLDGYVTS